jgi:hypothetical protein
MILTLKYQKAPMTFSSVAQGSSNMNIDLPNSFSQHRGITHAQMVYEIAYQYLILSLDQDRSKPF